MQVGPSLLVLGNESRENGLKDSLLERLETIYNEIGHVAAPYSLTLSINHRCNREIVEIPNKLFYSNQIKANPITVPSHPYAEYPLIFVCSSISNDWNPKIQETEAKTEARLLLEEAFKYVSRRSWPEDWGQHSDNKFSILASTTTQVYVFSIRIIIYIYTYRIFLGGLRGEGICPLSPLISFLFPLSCISKKML